MSFKYQKFYKIKKLEIFFLSILGFFLYPLLVNNLPTNAGDLGFISG